MVSTIDGGCGVAALSMFLSFPASKSKPSEINFMTTIMWVPRSWCHSLASRSSSSLKAYILSTYSEIAGITLPKYERQYGSDRKNVAKAWHSEDTGKTENYHNETGEDEELHKTGAKRKVYDARSTYNWHDMLEFARNRYFNGQIKKRIQWKGIRMVFMCYWHWSINEVRLGYWLLIFLLTDLGRYDVQNVPLQKSPNVR